MAPALLLSRDADGPAVGAASVADWTVLEDTPERSVVVQDADNLDGLWRYHSQLRRRSRILVMDAVEPDWRALLEALFLSVTTGDEIQGLLPVDQLAEVLDSADRADLLIGGFATPHAVVLYRGDLRSLVVPCDWFSTRPAGTPDFRRLAIVDYGQTVRLGDYEVATEALLYEWDADYRRRIKERRLVEDDSFGGSLRRLRLQKGLRRTEFPGLSDKEVARIERGEVGTPHGRTLEILFRRLGVKADEIGSY